MWLSSLLWASHAQEAGSTQWTDKRHKLYPLSVSPARTFSISAQHFKVKARFHSLALRLLLFEILAYTDQI